MASRYEKAGVVGLVDNASHVILSQVNCTIILLFLPIIGYGNCLNVFSWQYSSTCSEALTQSFAALPNSVLQ